MDIKPGNVVRLKKKHPCGSFEWRVVKADSDITIELLKCKRNVAIKRSLFERRVTALISSG